MPPERQLHVQQDGVTGTSATLQEAARCDRWGAMRPPSTPAVSSRRLFETGRDPDLAVARHREYGGSDTFRDHPMKSTHDQPPPLPDGLPVPINDGAAGHLLHRSMPDLALPSTDGGDLNLAELAADQVVLYVFPKMGRPDEADPPGWDAIPGARGCTQQSCAFRDLHDQFRDLGYTVVGVSAQLGSDQQEAAQRLHLSFPLLADPTRRLGKALDLPVHRIAGATYYRRMTLVARAGRIVKLFYPVFPPDENATQVLAWIRSEAGG